MHATRIDLAGKRRLDDAELRRMSRDGKLRMDRLRAEISSSTPRSVISK